MKKYKKVLIFLLKLVLTGLSLWYVLSGIDLRETGEHLSQANWLYLVPALFYFVLSKVVSAQRLNLFFQSIGLGISVWNNLKLYLLGMLYNLFLPGGIGGDGYKVYWLNKHTNVSAKKITFAVLIDRVNGMLAVVALTLLLALFLPLPLPLWSRISAPFLVAGGYAAYLLVIRHFFGDFREISHRTTLYSVGVQILQCCCVFYIMGSFGIREHYPELLALFMISSIVAALPFTIGGLGAREFVFVAGSNLLHLDPNASVSISITFYLITAVTSFAGIYYHFRPSGLICGEK